MTDLLLWLSVTSLLLDGIPLTTAKFRPPCPSESTVLKWTREKIRKALRDFRVLPDLVSEPPRLPVMVEWIEDEAEFGNYIKTDILKLAPFWVEWKCRDYEWHTVMMIGLDEPSATNPVLRQYQFWVVGNVEGHDVIIGEPLTDYIPPRPANNSGPHRYVVLVYRQPQKLDFMEYHLTDTKMTLFTRGPYLASAILWASICLKIPGKLYVEGEKISTTKQVVKQRGRQETTTCRLEEETWPEPDESVKPRGELTADLLRHDIIPDFIYDVPFGVCTAEWNKGGFADLGNLIPVDALYYKPYTVDWNGNQSEYYTIVMSGLDEPSRKDPKLREYQHWILVNIPGSRFQDGETLVYYKGPERKEGTGMHRHGLVVYKQPGKMEFTDEKPILTRSDDKRRGNFSNVHFAAKHHLGEPLAINFFQTEWIPPPTPSTVPAWKLTSPRVWTSWIKSSTHNPSTLKSPD